MEADKKQEFKDFSLNNDILINELSEDEISKLFPSPKTQKTETKDEPVICERFVDAAIKLSQRGKTENSAATYVTSDDPRIDFFFKVLEDTYDNVTISLLERSWDFNCLDTLRLIAYLRDIRSGKSIRYQYYVCLYWMYKHHPRTLMQNIKILLDCGYYKDLLQLLMVILFKGKISSYLFQEEFKNNSRISRKKSIVGIKKKIDDKLKSTSADDKAKLDKKEIRKIKGDFYKTMNSELNENLVDYYKNEINKKYKPLTVKVKTISVRRKFRKEVKSDDSIEIRERTANEIDKKYLDELRLRYARERFNNDKKYRYFHLKFAELFAKQLIGDLKNLNENKLNKLSLAAKWAPSLAGHFDKYTLIASSVALQVAKLTRNQESITSKVAKLTLDQESVKLQLTKDQDSNLEEIFTKPIPIATYLARKHYHKNYLVKLREKLKIPETFMCNRQWNILPYERVASKCMQKNRKSFKEHDSDRFEQFVKSKEKISGATLKPPELVQRAMNLKTHDDDIERELVEKQWNSLKDSIKLDNKESCFKSAVSVCDVSGSMSGTPMLAAIGLTIMTMSFTDEPWSNLCLTFSESPKFVHFEKNLSFSKKVERILNGGWGYNTNLTKTFELIIEVAKKNELKQSEMPKFLFIFTDMEFDCACRAEETNFEEAKRLFKEAGYELPTIVFWNLRDTKSVPIQKDENGTILLSGYSAQQLSLLLNMNVENITPFAFIEDILKIKKYEDLVVID